MLGGGVSQRYVAQNFGYFFQVFLFFETFDSLSSEVRGPNSPPAVNGGRNRGLQMKEIKEIK